MKDIVNKIASILNNNHGVDSKDITVIEERLNRLFSPRLHHSLEAK